jgi:hypothetical protein
VVGHTLFHEIYREISIGKTRQHDQWDARKFSLEIPDDLNSIAMIHRYISNDDGNDHEMLSLGEDHGLLAIFGLGDVAA